MRVELIFPGTPEETLALQRKIAALHARIVTEYIAGIPCSETERAELFRHMRQRAAQIDASIPHI